MLIIVTYDVGSIEEKNGKARLKKVAKTCMNYGQRVQNSVFECYVDNCQYLLLKTELLKIIDEKKDSIRFYNLGNKYANRIEDYGCKEKYDPKGIIEV